MDDYTSKTMHLAPRGLSYAMGNFDGVHRGHLAVLKKARNHGPLGVISFSPHPRRFFNSALPAFELMSLADKNRVFKSLDVAEHIILDFNAEMAAMSPAEFFTMIRRALDFRHLAVGENFRFGRDRAGDPELLRNLADPFHIGVGIAATAGEGAMRFSSSAVRDALISGNPRDAAKILGRPHIVSGLVQKGDQRGRELGFPTANLVPTAVMLPKYGIYACRVEIHTGRYRGIYNGASSTGIRPSFGTNAPNFETFILDFDGDIYGQDISVSLIEYLRPELKFQGIAALIKQMDADVARCREILETESA